MQSKIYEYLKSNPKIDILITKDEKESRLVEQCAKYLGYDSFVMPDFRASYGDDLRSYKDELIKLSKTLFYYHSDMSKGKKLLISPFRTLFHQLPKRELFKFTVLEFAGQIDLPSFKKDMLYWGYEIVEIVQQKGEVSFRGDIIDIFPIDSEYPYRVSLFDNEIESIRVFDFDTQKSIKDDIESIRVIPATFGLSEIEYEKIEQKVLNLESDSFVKDINSLGFWVLDELGKDYIEDSICVKLYSYENEIDEYVSINGDDKIKDKFLQIDTIKEPEIYKDIEIVDLASLLEFHKSKKITIIAKNEASIKHLNLENFNFVDIKYSDLVLNVLSEKELIVSLNQFHKKRRRLKSKIIIDELKQNDYVVHENYGVGIFKGLTSTKVLGVVRDFVEIAYYGDDRLLVPVENLSLIDRYISDGGTLAVVDKLGKNSFIKMKQKTKAKLFEIAKEIIEIAASRELIEAPKIDIDFSLLRVFQNDANFRYTQDQQKSIKEIYDDLKSSKVMDRLLSGDVGFGKTEVAMNAIFCVVKSGFQAAFLVPTTLLSSQHYKSLQERFEKYDIKVAKLDRFTPSKEKSLIISGLKDGTIDVCVGTHVLLGVEFNNLALMVLDEEHKFGVKQKEKLKSLKKGLHILSMSATPIPRSLNMALSSIKQYSQLLTPPDEREDIRSFVKEYDEKLLKEIILREIKRGGQVFYLHNSIATMEDKKRELGEIVNNAKILALHSKISPLVTEKEILAFQKKEYDILISTTIIESGIHIPNVNTIIIENADRFGMADLHQLRGRVGRSDRVGYCYFLVKDRQKITDDAKKRLVALESNSFLGSGSVLAYHDLEIRGGGNLIGEAQSGHIKNIGYSLYLKMLEDAINTLLNQHKDEKKEVEIKLAVSAYIDSMTINEDRIRLELYRRLSKCQDLKEVYEIEEEMIDRFGKLDERTKLFLDIIIIKILASKKGIKIISSYQQNITIIYEDESKELIKSPSRDDDDVVQTTVKYLRSLK